MNDATILSFYIQLLQFSINNNRHEILFNIPTNSQQRNIQCLAHKMNLEYEYALATRTVRIIHAGVLKPSVPFDTVFGFINFDPPHSTEQVLNDTFGLLHSMNIDATFANPKVITADLPEGFNSLSNLSAFNSHSNIQAPSLPPAIKLAGIYPTDSNSN